jgi:hypothetical protein
VSSRTSWTKWLLAPLHVLALATTSKSFENNPVIGSPALNRRGLHVTRKRLAMWVGALRRRKLAGLLTAEDRAAIDRDGFVVKQNFLEPAGFAALRAEIMAMETDAREFVDGYSLTRLIPLDAQNLARLPAARQVLQGARYRGLHDYAGSFRRRPHLFVQSIFSHVRDAPPDVQSFFHTDTFHPTVKSWFFLTDVAEDGAAFTYVPGSHRANARHLAWECDASAKAGAGSDRSSAEGSLRISDEDLATLGYPEPVRFSVAANTLVVADTSGFHRRGITTVPGLRISIWGYARSNPFVPWTMGSPLDLPVLRDHAIRLFWRLQDAVKKLRGKQGGWRWVGLRRPATPPDAANVASIKPGEVISSEFEMP